MVYCASKLIENFKLFYKSNGPHFLWVYRSDITSRGDYQAGTAIESVVYCLIKLFVVCFGRFGSIWTHAYYSLWTP